MYFKKKLLFTALSLGLVVQTPIFGEKNSFVEKQTMAMTFSEIANEYEHSLFEHNPELGLFWGKSNVAMDRFMDASPEGYQRWRKKEDQLLVSLQNLDTKTIQNTPNYATYLLLKETLQASQASRVCKEELWDVNPAAGWHNQLTIVAAKQPIGTPDNRKAALARWQTFDKVVDNQINNLKLGVSLGYSAPKPAVQRVLMQINIILQSPIEASPYFDFARRDTDPNFKNQVRQLMTRTILPALQHYAEYLEQDYLPVARTQIGVSALPAGIKCYQAKIQEETTLSLTPDDIHIRGLQTIQALSQEVGAIGMKQYGIQDSAAIFNLAKQESLHSFKTEQDILDYNFAALARVKAKMPDWFTSMPDSEGIIKPYPDYRAKTGASGEYYPPNEEGTEPGIFYINTFEPEQQSPIDQEAVLFHELIPGHHYQIALHYENQLLPRVNRYLFNAGFGEGWALYVERLADEMGLYQDDISRLGMLSNEMLRAARLVVDTGIHAFGWGRAQAIDYLKQHTTLNDNIIEGEVDRYSMLPGQATAYMLGKQEIMYLRQLAKDELGEHFDIREFHDQVLKNGMVSLPILRTEITQWLLK